MAAEQEDKGVEVEAKAVEDRESLMWCFDIGECHLWTIALVWTYQLVEWSSQIS